MKNYNLILPLVFIVALFTHSCKKDSDTNSTTVEYRITPMNVYFTKIKYNDKSGNTVTITDPSGFANGSKSISITSKPFLAKIETELLNSTNATIQYNLVVVVNGEIKATKSVQANPTVTTVSSAEYSVQ